jgi:hypothetical protein
VIGSVPEVSPARAMPKSALADAPGYVPPDDPEIESVQRGFRIVDPIDAPFVGGEKSLDILAEKILAGIQANDGPKLHDLRITRDEFETILWPEFPQSRPVTNIASENAWFFLYHHCTGGINKTLQEWGGTNLEFKGVSFTKGVTHYTNFSSYEGLLIHAVTNQGHEVILDFADTVVERNGSWKVYIYKD